MRVCWIGFHNLWLFFWASTCCTEPSNCSNVRRVSAGVWFLIDERVLTLLSSCRQKASFLRASSIVSMINLFSISSRWLLLRAAKARLTQRTKDLDRAQTLADRYVAAKTQVEDAQIEMELTMLTVEQAGMTAVLADIEYEQARNFLEHRTLNSPIDGVVITVQAAPGAFASVFTRCTSRFLHPSNITIKLQ